VQIAEFILNAALREGGSALPCAAVQGKEVTSQIHER
jgi:hypothetical protein